MHVKWGTTDFNLAGYTHDLLDSSHVQTSFAYFIFFPGIHLQRLNAFHARKKNHHSWTIFHPFHHISHEHFSTTPPEDTLSWILNLSSIVTLISCLHYKYRGYPILPVSVGFYREPAEATPDSPYIEMQAAD